MQTAHDRAHSAPDADPGDFDEAFDASFGVVAFIANRHLIHHVLRASREFGLDFESLILWGVLAHQNVLHLVGRPATGAAVPGSRLRQAANPDELRPVRIRDLNQITSIPRETIRRKLNLMEKRDFVRRHADGGWVMNASAVGPQMRAFTRETVRQLLQCADQVRGALGEAGRALAESPASSGMGVDPSSPAR